MALHDLAERPERDPVAVGQAAALEPAHIRGLHLDASPELGDDPALADTRLTGDQQHRRPPVRYGALEGRRQRRDFTRTADVRPAVLDPPASGGPDRGGPEDPDRVDLALDRRRGELGELDRVTRGSPRRLADGHPQLGRHRLDPGRRVHGVPRHEPLSRGRIHVQPDEGLPGVDPDPQPEAVVRRPGTDREPGPDRSHAVVLVGQRDTEHADHGIPDELFDDPAVCLDRRASHGRVAIEHPADILRVCMLGERGEANQVAEQHGHDLALLDPGGGGFRGRRCGQRQSARRAEAGAHRALEQAPGADQHGGNDTPRRCWLERPACGLALPPVVSRCHARPAFSGAVSFHAVGRIRPVVQRSAEREGRAPMAGRTDEAEGGAGEIVGQARQLDAIESFLDPGAWPRALLLEGEPGIGKTTLWLRAVERAAERGIAVLTCRPVEAEASMSFGALVDLFAPIPDDLLVAVPDAQARALAAALRRRLPDGPLPDPLAVSAGARAVLERLAASRPVVVAIDDVQWLDPSSAAVLAYIVRRLAGMPVGLLLAQRQGGSDGDRLPIGDRLAVNRVSIPPLSLSSLHHVIRRHTGQVLPRPLLHRIADVSGGNPLFAITLAEAIRDAGGPPAPGDPLPAPRTLLDLVAARVASLEPADMEALVAVACLATPTTELVTAAVGGGAGRALANARAAGILAADGDPLRFVHPLYAQCVLRIAGDSARRAVYGRIAATVADPEERSRHLALASRPPDASVANALDEGAAAARARGALRAAAELLDEARRFTPSHDPSAAHRRAFEAAELAILAGDRGVARALLAPVVEAAAEPTRARAVGLYAELLANEGAGPEAEALLRDAIAGDPGPDVLARLHLDLAYVALTRLDAVDAMASGGRASLAARLSGDDAILAEAIAYEALARTLAGHDVEPGMLDEALRHEDRTRPPYMGLPPSGVAGLVHAFTADHATARRLLGAAGESLDAMGDDCDLAHVLLWSGWLALRDGRLAEAAVLAHDAATTAESTGSPLLRDWAVALSALTAAARGDAAGTASAIADATRADRGSGGIVGAWLAAAAGQAALASGDVASAARVLGPLGAAASAAGFGEPVIAFFVPDAAEALARSGDPAGAGDVLRPFELAATARGRGWAVAAAQRARAEILAAEGHPDDALLLLRSVPDIQGFDTLPLEWARTLLARGRLERRLGERRSARATLDAAARAFEDAGAEGWAAAVAAELRRIPGRRVGADEITPSERRVAELSGAGRTNREVAAALYLEPEDRGGQPRADLPEARDHDPRRARGVAREEP